MTEISCVFPFGCYPFWAFLFGVIVVSSIVAYGLMGLALLTAEVRSKNRRK